MTRIARWLLTAPVRRLLGGAVGWPAARSAGAPSWQARLECQPCETRSQVGTGVAGLFAVALGAAALSEPVVAMAQAFGEGALLPAAGPGEATPAGFEPVFVGLDLAPVDAADLAVWPADAEYDAGAADEGGGFSAPRNAGEDLASAAGGADGTSAPVSPLPTPPNTGDGGAAGGGSPALAGTSPASSGPGAGASPQGNSAASIGGIPAPLPAAAGDPPVVSPGATTSPPMSVSRFGDLIQAGGRDAQPRQEAPSAPGQKFQPPGLGASSGDARGGGATPDTKANSARVTTGSAALAATGTTLDLTRGSAAEVVVARFTGPAPGKQPYTATVFWGDGSSSPGQVVLGPDRGYEVLASHAFRFAGRFGVAVEVSGPAGALALARTEARVVAPPAGSPVQAATAGLAHAAHVTTGLPPAQSPHPHGARSSSVPSPAHVGGGQQWEL